MTKENDGTVTCIEAGESRWDRVEGWSADLMVTTRGHTCCECCTMAAPLSGKKSHPTVHPLLSVISSPDQGWAVADCFQQVCQLLFQAVLMRAGTGHCSNPKNGWTMTFMAVTLHCNNDPYFPEFREKERMRNLDRLGTHSTALNAMPSPFNRRFYALHATFCHRSHFYGNYANGHIRN